MRATRSSAWMREREEVRLPPLPESPPRSLFAERARSRAPTLRGGVDMGSTVTQEGKDGMIKFGQVRTWSAPYFGKMALEGAGVRGCGVEES